MKRFYFFGLGICKVIRILEDFKDIFYLWKENMFIYIGREELDKLIVIENSRFRRLGGGVGFFCKWDDVMVVDL